MMFEVVVKAETEEEANQMESKINQLFGGENWAKVRELPGNKHKKARA